jgi:hypothetical protein
MKRQIICDKNLVFIQEEAPVLVDCTALLDKGYVFIGEDEEGIWAETAPFSGRLRDIDDTPIQDLFAQAEMLLADMVPTPPTLEEQVRTRRNTLLSVCDWKVLPGSPYNTSELRAYRQALRDITDQPGFPWNGPDDPACPWPTLEENDA